MTADERLATLRQALLKELESCGSHAVPENALVNAMYAQVSPPPTRADVVSALRWLDDEGYATAIRPPLGGAVVYIITTMGRAVLNA